MYKYISDDYLYYITIVKIIGLGQVPAKMIGPFLLVLSTKLGYRVHKYNHVGG